MHTETKLDVVLGSLEMDLPSNGASANASVTTCPSVHMYCHPL